MQNNKKIEPDLLENERIDDLEFENLKIVFYYLILQKK